MSRSFYLRLSAFICGSHSYSLFNQCITIDAKYVADTLEGAPGCTP